MSSIRTVMSVTTVLVLSLHSSAGIRPSLSLLYSAWHATDIVVVTEGEAVDGDVTVLEVWHGSLTVGESITVPELSAFASDANRTVRRPWRAKDDDTPPVIVSPKRMVLFLRRAAVTPASDKRTRGSEWRPASQFGGMKVATAWITDGRVYAFTQVKNPGPSILTDQGYSEGEMRIEVDRTVAERRLLRRIAAFGDAGAKARQAAKHVDSLHYFARKEAFAILGGCGKDALPVLRRILRDENRRNLHRATVKTLAVAGDKDVVPELIAIVEAELRFWEETAPGLKRGWWNGAGLEWKRVDFLINRYGFVLEVFYALRRIRSPACRDAVTRFKDYWRSLPQLEYLDDLSNACDAVLRALPEE